MLVVALAALVAAGASAQFIAVFVDGRILDIAGARLVDERTIRLEFKGGANLEIPLSRLDRVIDDGIDPVPEPVPEQPPKCPYTASEERLPAATPYALEIERAASAAGLHPRLVAAVVAVESAFKPYAVSRVGAAGLMQLMPSVWLAQGLATPWDPASNLVAGARHLRAMIDRFGDVTLALAAYNAGTAPVERYGGVPPYRETRAYVREVLGRFCPGAAPDATATPGSL